MQNLRLERFLGPISMSLNFRPEYMTIPSKIWKIWRLASEPFGPEIGICSKWQGVSKFLWKDILS